MPKSISNGNHQLFVRVKDSLNKWSLTEQKTFTVDSTLTPVDNSNKIITAEYFIDTDPGVGNGIAITVTNSDSININSNIAIPKSISGGFHQLFIRVKDSLNIWGITEQRAFYVDTTLKITSVNPKLVAAEYFFGADSGIGKGTAVNVSMADSILQNIGMVLPVLPVGATSLNIRYKDSLGKWGLVESRNLNVVCKPDLGKDTSVVICSSKFVNITGLYNYKSYASYIWSTTRPDSVTQSGNDTLIVTGIYGCKDTALVSVRILSPVTSITNLNGCDSIVYNGNKYFNSFSKTDTIKTTGGCDSIYNVTNIIVNKVNPVKTNVIINGCNSVFFNNSYYFTSTILKDTVKSVSGCGDSLYKTINIKVYKILPVSNFITLSGCNSVYYNLKYYTASTEVDDTVRSVTGCDSIYNIVYITINNSSPLSDTVNLNSCDSVFFHNVVYKHSNTIIDTLRTPNGCDSLYFVTMININNINISGNLISANNKTIPNVSLNIAGTNTLTGTFTGNYNFNCISDRMVNTVSATKNNDVNKANGVTALDIALVQSHILQKNLLNSPYKIIAADVTGDGKVTALDIVYMKRLILGIDTTFTNLITHQKRLWAFVDSSYKISDTINPFPIKDSIIVTNTNSLNQTLIGCKLGDVNWDWNPAIAKQQVNNTDAIELMYSIAPQSYKTSDSYIHIPVKVKNFKNMLGMQFTISFDPSVMQWQGIGNNPLGIETGTSYADDGSISFLWVDPKNVIKTLDDGSLLMELIFARTGDCTNLQFEINSSVTTIAAYDKDENFHNIVLKQSMKTIPDIINESWKVVSNPATTGKISVQLQLKDSKTVLFKLVDVSGKILYMQKNDGIKGVNTFILRAEPLIPNGIYFLQVIGIEGDKVKKVIVQN